MSSVFVIRNQHGHYWGRGKRWADGREVQKVAVNDYRDEAVNTVFELSSKDTELRCDVLEMDLEEGKLPRLAISEVPLPDEDDPQQTLENLVKTPMSDSVNPNTPEN